MYRIICNKIQGFECTDKNIRVFDKYKRPFYVFNRTKGKKTRFNLPKGVYYTENNLKRLLLPIKYRIKALPKERRIKRPKKFKLRWGDNPNKASVVLKKGIILIDKSFKKFPSFVATFILFHEIGHYWYKSERGADSFARVQMLKRGFNPVQIGMASRLTLSKKSKHRIKCNFDALKKV